MMILNLSYADYCDAGKPYGNQGYPKWIHEEYNKRISELEESLAAEKDEVDLKSACIKGLSCQCDQLAAQLETARKDIKYIARLVHDPQSAIERHIEHVCKESLAQLSKPALSTSSGQEDSKDILNERRGQVKRM